VHSRYDTGGQDKEVRLCQGTGAAGWFSGALNVEELDEIIFKVYTLVKVKLLFKFILLSRGIRMIIYRAVEQKDKALLGSIITENWGSTKIVSKGRVHNVIDLPGFVAEKDGMIKGLVTYEIDDDGCEIVSLDSFYENVGIGTNLIRCVCNQAKNQKCKRVWLITTNDNITAIRYYQKRNFKMINVYIGAIEISRRLKPEIPLTGFDGIPILHEIEFEKLI